MAKRKKANFDFSSLDFDLDLNIRLGQSEAEFVKAAKWTASLIWWTTYTLAKSI